MTNIMYILKNSNSYINRDSIYPIKKRVNYPLISSPKNGTSLQENNANCTKQLSFKGLRSSYPLKHMLKRLKTIEAVKNELNYNLSNLKKILHTNQNILYNKLRDEKIANSASGFNNEEMFEILIKASTKKGSKILKLLLKNTPSRFKGKDIADLLKCYNNENSKILKKLIKFKDVSNNDYRFNSQEMINLLNNYKPEQAKLFNKLLNIKQTNKNQDYRFNSQEMINLLSNYKPEQAKLFNKLLNIKQTKIRIIVSILKK